MTGHHSVEDKRIRDDATLKRVLALKPKSIVESFKEKGAFSVKITHILTLL